MVEQPVSSQCIGSESVKLINSLKSQEGLDLIAVDSENQKAVQKEKANYYLVGKSPLTTSTEHIRFSSEKNELILLISGESL